MTEHAVEAASLQASVETVPAPKHVEHTETPHGGVAPVSIQNTNVSPDAMGISGIAARIAGVSILAIFVALYIVDRYDDRAMKREKAVDDKTAAAKRDTDIERFHKEFQEHDQKKWQAVEKLGDKIEKNTDESKRGALEINMKLGTLIEEVKKGKMGGGGP